MKSNITEDICYAQPKSLAQRLAIGNDFIRRYHFPLPFAVDDMDNAADLAYACVLGGFHKPQANETLIL